MLESRSESTSTKSQSDRHETAGIMREGGGVINPHSIKGVQI